MKFSALMGATLPALTLLAFSTGASATALTGTVTADYLFPNEGSNIGSSVLTVGTALNCPGGAGTICAIFARPAEFLASDLSITLSEQAGSSYSAADFNGIRFSGLTFDDGSSLIGFSLETNLAGLTVSNVTLTPTSIQFNAQGLEFLDSGYTIKLNLITATAAVPEPASWALMIGGFGLIGASMRRRFAKVAFV